MPCDHDAVTTTPPTGSAPSAVARRELRFGISVTPLADAHSEIVAQVLAAERGGLDVVGIQDHPYQRRFLDTFALVADLLARTSRLRFFPDVANLPLRPPTMLAKAAASLDVMSGGRFELGIGAGGFWDAVAGMGGPRRSPSEAADALEEAIPIIRAALDVGPDKRVVRGTGRHFPIPGYPPGPAPAHRVEIWVGAYRPRGLRLIGRLADGWVPSYGHMGPDDFRVASARINEAAIGAGRDPTTIRRIYNIPGVITGGSRSDDPLVGPADQWIETLTSWALELGVDTFVYWPPEGGAAPVERFAAEVAPAVREAVDRERPQRD
jgi:alkanesulfonate monooxygenase SsuD/methylene tetrahydromethanopterin reductase-like flavin-dependent oxidoreductase (luciferase family)